jgi:hypothetical protein
MRRGEGKQSGQLVCVLSCAGMRTEPAHTQSCFGPFPPSSLLCQVGGCCHNLCPTGPLVRAFWRGQPRGNLQCLAEIALCSGRAGAAGG